MAVAGKFVQNINVIIRGGGSGSIALRYFTLGTCLRWVVKTHNPEKAPP